MLLALNCLIYYTPCHSHRSGFRVAALPGDDFPGRVGRDCFGRGGGNELCASLPPGNAWPPVKNSQAAPIRTGSRWRFIAPDSFRWQDLQAQTHSEKESLSVEAVNVLQLIVISGIYSDGVVADLAIVDEARSQRNGLAVEGPQEGPGAGVRGHLVIEVACQTQGEALGKVLAQEVLQVKLVAGAVPGAGVFEIYGIAQG